MQLSQIPAKIAAIFAASAPPTSKNTIPLTQAGTTQPGQASFDVGFPSVTMQPASSGGVNPYGQDFNGILSAVTGVQRWQNSGAGFPYDATFSASIGGYPAGTQLVRADGMGYWLNQTDNNTSNPDTGGAGWVPFAPGWTNGVDTGAANACVVNFTPGIVALSDGMVLWFKAAAANTGATTLNVNGLGAKAVVGGAHAALQGGEIIASGKCNVVWNATINAFVLIECTGGALQVSAGTQSGHSVRKSQFSAPMSASSTQSGANTTLGVTASFTAPGPGLLFAIGARNVGGTTSQSNTGTLSINGSAVASDSTPSSMTHFGFATISAGQSVNANYTAASAISFSVCVTLIWIPNGPQ